VGAPLETIAQQDWVLFHTSEEVDIDPVTLQRLRMYDSWQLQKQGSEEIGRQIGLFVKKSDNLETTTILYMLTKGLCYFDARGNLLPTSSGAVDTVSMGIAASHQGQLNYGGSDLISASWNVPSANIPLMVRNVVEAACQSTGYEPEFVMYGKNLPGYIQQNSFCKEYLARNPPMNNTLMSTGEIPDGFLGLTWLPAWKAFYEDANGSNQRIVDPDLAVFMPKPTKTWYEMVLGSMQVPTTINILTSVETAMSNVDIKYGKYTYAQLENKPIRLIIVQGHTFLPTITVPDALWQADTVA
jgi:hypothetical protein